MSKEKKFCDRCKTGFPADRVWQGVRQFWLICESCSREWHSQDEPEPTRIESESEIKSGFHQAEVS
jgi:hypothetical protein